MCAIIGIYLKNPSTSDLAKVKSVFLESRVRGMHATGLSYFKNGKVETIKEACPATEFAILDNLESLINENNELLLIGHCRYSTSDLTFNQPISLGTSLSVVHNGVITQEDPANWEKLYNTNCQTRNDTELLYHTIEQGECVLDKWSDASLAVCTLNDSGVLTAYRNGKRPLYLTNVPNGSIITSTFDIALRSGIFVGSDTDCITTGLCSMNSYYNFGATNYNSVDTIDIDGAMDHQC